MAGFLLPIAMALVFLFFLGIGKAYSNSATVPLSIEVHGKLIITDENNDNKSTRRVNSTSHINLDRRREFYNVVSENGLRIRTNVKKWRLIATITEDSVEGKSISSKNILLRYKTSAGSSANPDAGRLVAPFNKKVRLKAVLKNPNLIVIEGNSKTSLERDKENENNWFGVNLVAEYNKRGSRSFKTKRRHRQRQYNATVSYALVSY